MRDTSSRTARSSDVCISLCKQAHARTAASSPWGRIDGTEYFSCLLARFPDGDAVHAVNECRARGKSGAVCERSLVWGKEESLEVRHSRIHLLQRDVYAC